MSVLNAPLLKLAKAMVIGGWACVCTLAGIIGTHAYLTTDLKLAAIVPKQFCIAVAPGSLQNLSPSVPRRATLAAMIVRVPSSIVLLSLCLLAFARVASAQTPPATQSSDQLTQSFNEFAIFGVHIDEPPMLRRTECRGHENIARWEVLDEKRQPVATLRLDVTPAKAETLQLEVASLNKKSGGVSSDAGFQVDGEQAIYVALPHSSKDANGAMIFVYHERRLYALGAFSSGQTPISSDAFRKLAKGIRFVPIEKPSAHMDLRDEPVTVLSSIRLKILNTMRPEVSKDVDRALFTLPDVRMNRPAMVLTATIQTVDPKMTLDENIKCFDRPEYGGRLIWHKPKLAMDARLSEAFRSKGKFTQLAFVNLDPTRRLLLIFQHTAADDDSIADYSLAASRMLESIERLD